MTVGRWLLLSLELVLQWSETELSETEKAGSRVSSAHPIRRSPLSPHSDRKTGTEVAGIQWRPVGSQLAANWPSWELA